MKLSSLAAGVALSALMVTGAVAADVYTGDKSLKDDSNYALGGALMNWSGPYIGAHGGYGWGNAEVRDINGGVPAGPFEYEPKGAFGGITAGYNTQFRNIVLGFEVDLGYMNVEGDAQIASSNPQAHQDLTLEGGFYGVAAGRLGVSLGRLLPYVKGGVAFFDGDATQTTTNPGFTTDETDPFYGFAYGGGIEYALTKDVTIKVEYLRFDFETAGGGQTSTQSGFTFKNETDLTIDTVKAGVNLHF